MVSCPSSTIQMSRSLCLKPKPFLDDPNSCNRAPVQQKTLFVNFIINVHSVLTIVLSQKYERCYGWNSEGGPLYQQTVVWQRSPGLEGCALLHPLPVHLEQNRLQRKQTQTHTWLVSYTISQYVVRWKDATGNKYVHIRITEAFLLYACKSLSVHCWSTKQFRVSKYFTQKLLRVRLPVTLRSLS